MPFFSVVVPVCNDWRALDKCLQSLSQQANAPEFEVVVVDDGSDNFAPRFIRQWESVYPLRIVRSPDTGIAAARNYGLRISRGTILVFTDADCRLEKNCLAELSQAISHSGHSWFQLHLTGDRSSLVGQTEDLRLTMLQNHLLDASGCLRYLNTSGFAVRRSELRIDEDLFDPAATRAEDTLLLATLVRKGQAPFFVRGATVEHAIPRSLLKRLRKDVLSAYLETYAFAKISAMGVRVRMTNRARCQMLRAMWTSHVRLSACSLLLIRQLLRRAVTSMCSLSQQRAQLFVVMREQLVSIRAEKRTVLRHENA